MSEKRMPKVGDVVVYHDELGAPHNALLTAVWTEDTVNLLYISGDEERHDSYGRQIERATSLLHGSKQDVHGNYWRYQEEAPNPMKEPVET